MDRASVWRQVRQQQQQQATGGGGNAAAVVASGAITACRPTGARWTPTQEQVMILKELYYGCGIRSPNPEQIQRIAARLRQYGRVEGKNVFYWFQNHKARERHKKRLGIVTSCGDTNNLAGVLSPGSGGATAAASSGCLFGAGNGGCGSAVQMDGSTTTTCWGDSAAAAMSATERSFVQLQDYMSVSVTRSTGVGNHGPTAPTRWPPCFSFSADQTLPPATREPETLPLFPTGGRHGGGGDQGIADDVVHNSYPQQHMAVQNSFQWWGAAAATNTSSSTMTFQQDQHHHQLQDQQYSFYSSNQQQLMMPSQDASTSLELTLSSPYYPARFM